MYPLPNFKIYLHRANLIRLCSYPVSSIWLHFIFKQIPQILFWSYSLGDLARIHRFKYTSYTEDSQIYYLHSSIAAQGMDFDTYMPGFESWLLHKVPLWSPASYLISTCLSYSICEIRWWYFLLSLGVVVRIKWVSIRKMLRTVPIHNNFLALLTISR